MRRTDKVILFVSYGIGPTIGFCHNNKNGLPFGGTALCSYRVRVVDGSCAKHLTVES